MKLKPHISFSPGAQVFRLLVSDSGVLVVESRDTEKKEAYYSGVDLKSGKIHFRNLQFEEKYWIGIEEIYDDIILFHGYARPNMPGHRGIFAYSIPQDKVLWSIDEYVFHFVKNNLIWVYKELFEKKEYYCFDPISGKLIEKKDLSEDELNIEYIEARSAKDYSHYLFPETFTEEECESNTARIISDKTNGLDLVGEVEYNKKGSKIVFSFHFHDVEKGIANKIICTDVETTNVLFEETLNTKLNLFVPDSYFIYDDFLITLKEKTKILVYSLA